MNPIAGPLAKLGGAFIALLVRVFGREYRRTDVPWIEGPIGGRKIGDAPYAEAAERENLTVERATADAGLIADFSSYRSDEFDPDRIAPLVREFYEHTAAFAMDVWSQTYFPSRIALYLLVLTISRQVGQLNFPISPLDTARGLDSEVIVLRRRDGSVRYTGWFRTLAESRHVLYTGFYMAARVPAVAGSCVKVVFPMPNGNATVVLRPMHGENGALILDSTGKRFGDSGFYRIEAPPKVAKAKRLRIWHIRTLHEKFNVYVDRHGDLRCDHTVHFLGMPVLKLHYKMYRKN